MAPSDMPPALAAKQIAGFIVAEPFNALAETMGIGKVLRFTGDIWRDHACCVAVMREDDLTRRPDWSQKVVNAMVKAQAWTRAHRAETAAILSKDGPNRYTPHATPVLTKVLAPEPTDRDAYLARGAIRHAGWQDRRIDFQPFPYPSYTEELVRRLKTTMIPANREFLDALDPAAAAAELVDDRFVRAAIARNGGMETFGGGTFSRGELIDP
jgi:NitT/TauT family transport system substrate-binding protein